MSPTLWLILNCSCAILAALAGGWLPMFIRFTHRRSQLILSFVSGLMLGVAMFVLLPHALEADRSIDRSVDRSVDKSIDSRQTHVLPRLILLLFPISISFLPRGWALA